MSFFNTDSQVETFLRAFRNGMEGLHMLGEGMKEMASVQKESLRMLYRMDNLMEKAEPLIDHVIEMAKKETLETTDPNPGGD